MIAVSVSNPARFWADLTARKLTKLVPNWLEFPSQVFMPSGMGELFVEHLTFRFAPPRRRKPFDLHRFLLRVKLYTFEAISTVVVLVLLADFAVREIYPIIRSIGKLLWPN
ncbi:MAG TPA: hypothetical protein VGS27_07800 [Candidatus Sulfotelmatobacter sp.]|nr:hypothetical protein [Candidatus Sulfotelmatobacter sp.]